MKATNGSSSGRRFGTGVGTVLLLLGVYTLFRGRHPQVGIALLAAGGTLLALGFLAPRALVRPAALWARLGEALSSVTTPILLSIVFFVVVTPVGVLRRLLGGDPLRRRAPSRGSYWEDAPTRQRDPRHFEKTY